MADKFLRIGGRDGNGLARPLKTDNKGHLYHKPTRGESFSSGWKNIKLQSGEENKIFDVVGFVSVERLGILFEGLGANPPNIGFRLRLKNENVVTHQTLPPFYDEFWHNLFLMEQYGDPLWDLLRYDQDEKMFTVSLNPLTCPYGFDLVVRNRDVNEVSVRVPYYYKVIEG